MIEEFDFKNSYEGFYKINRLNDYPYYEKIHPGLRKEIETKIEFLSEQENLESCKEFISTCVKEGDNYKFFGIHEKTACMYGKKKEDIIQVRMRKSKNQDRNYDEPAYWGFFNISRGNFSLIYQSLVCLTVCFPGSMDSYEKIREGLFLKLDIIEEL